MKRVQAACILQTLVFMQKEELNYSPSEAIELNSEELQKYLNDLVESKIRYKIESKKEQKDGSIILHIKKQYSASSPVGEYF